MSRVRPFRIHPHSPPWATFPPGGPHRLFEKESRLSEPGPLEEPELRRLAHHPDERVTLHLLSRKDLFPAGVWPETLLLPRVLEGLDGEGLHCSPLLDGLLLFHPRCIEPSRMGASSDLSHRALRHLVAFGDWIADQEDPVALDDLLHFRSPALARCLVERAGILLPHQALHAMEALGDYLALTRSPGVLAYVPTFHALVSRLNAREEGGGHGRPGARAFLNVTRKAAGGSFPHPIRAALTELALDTSASPIDRQAARDEVLLMPELSPDELEALAQVPGPVSGPTLLQALRHPASTPTSRDAWFAATGEDAIDVAPTIAHHLEPLPTDVEERLFEWIEAALLEGHHGTAGPRRSQTSGDGPEAAERSEVARGDPPSHAANDPPSVRELRDPEGERAEGREQAGSGGSVVPHAPEPPEAPVTEPEEARSPGPAPPSGANHPGRQVGYAKGLHGATDETSRARKRKGRRARDIAHGLLTRPDGELERIRRVLVAYPLPLSSEAARSVLRNDAALADPEISLRLVRGEHIPDKRGFVTHATQLSRPAAEALLLHLAERIREASPEHRWAEDALLKLLERRAPRGDLEMPGDVAARLFASRDEGIRRRAFRLLGHLPRQGPDSKHAGPGLER